MQVLTPRVLQDNFWESMIMEYIPKTRFYVVETPGYKLPKGHKINQERFRDILQIEIARQEEEPTAQLISCSNFGGVLRN